MESCRVYTTANANRAREVCDLIRRQSPKLPAWLVTESLGRTTSVLVPKVWAHTAEVIVSQLYLTALQAELDRELPVCDCCGRIH